MNYKCIRRCTFKGRSFEINNICDFGNDKVPHHFVATNEETNMTLPKSRVDIMAAKPQSINAKSFYEMSKQKTPVNGGFASSISNEEAVHTVKLKVKK